jgi:hypothetical protein
MQALHVSVGDHVFFDHAEEEVGAVRQVAKDHLVIYIENAGDFVVRGNHVKSAHDGKVILDPETVDADLADAARKAHEREDS